MRLDTTLSNHACDHFGIISIDEARRLGATSDQLEYRVATGTLQPLHPGVYRHAAAPESWEGRLRAALLGAGSWAFASGLSAMRLYGIRSEWGDAIELTVLGVQPHVLTGVHVRRIDRLDGGDVTLRFGLPVLAPPLALLLLGAVTYAPKVEAAMHDMLHLRLTTRARLRSVLARYGGRGRRGTRSFRLALRSLPAARATETNLELDVLRLIRAHGLPEPTPQHNVVDATGRRRRLDFAYVDEKLDIETDGDRWHTSPADRTLDRARDNAVGNVGWRVLRFTPDDVHNRPGQTVAAIRRSLSARPELFRVS